MSTQSIDPKASLKLPSRPATPSDKTGLVSRTGLDVEAQILDGGGVSKPVHLDARPSVDARTMMLNMQQPQFQRQLATHQEDIGAAV